MTDAASFRAEAGIAEANPVRWPHHSVPIPSVKQPIHFHH
jgi:hypothetical protein